MNYFYINIDNYKYDENELIELLINKLKEIGYFDYEVNNICEEIKENYKNFEKIMGVDKDELIDMDYSEFSEKLTKLL